MRSNPSRVAALCSFALIAGLTATPAAARWPHDPAVNVPVSPGTTYQIAMGLVDDGQDGVIAVWADAPGYYLRAQRISPEGRLLWGSSGLSLGGYLPNSSHGAVTHDGEGGAIAVRSEGTAMYAHRVTRDGVTPWPAAGAPVCILSGTKDYPAIAADGLGGAVIAWEDQRGGTRDVYAQRLDADGNSLWTPDGVLICGAAGDQTDIQITSDGRGAALVAWVDARTGTTDIYARAVNSNGVPQGAVDGEGVCTAAGAQTILRMAPDLQGTAVLSWEDQRTGSRALYAQRLTASTAGRQWTVNGVVVCPDTRGPQFHTSAPDGNGGAILVWQENTATGGWDVMAQRISSLGVVLWSGNGATIGASNGYQGAQVVTADNLGGAVVTFGDSRSGQTVLTATRISSGGGLVWTQSSYGTPLTVPRWGIDASTCHGVWTPGRGFTAFWYDYRNGSDYRVFAQLVDEWGYLGAEPAMVGVEDVPNDQGGRVKVSWEASPLDTDPLYRNIRDYYVFRSAPPNAVATALAAGRVRPAALAATEGAAPAAGVWSTQSSGQTYYWEYLGTQAAYHLPGYSIIATTTSDSVAGSNPWTAFMVMANRNTGSGWWSSEPDSGYSVDDLAPAAPAAFTGQYQGPETRLHWAPNREADLAGYRLHRAKGMSFTPDESNLVAALVDTGYVDAAGEPFYYRLIALDAHGNRSPSTLLQPEGVVAVAGPPQVRALALGVPAPNPAHGAATIALSLPHAGQATLALYDASGRRVRSLLEGPISAGEHLVHIPLSDDVGRALAPGLFFIRLDTPGGSRTRRLAVIR